MKTKLPFTILNGSLALLLGLSSVQSNAQNPSLNSTPEFKPTINVFASGFGDYYVKTKADSSGRGAGNVTYKSVPANQSSFASRRAYLGADFTFSKNLSGQIVLANELQSGGYGVDASGNNVTYVKYAYAKWTNIFPKSNLLIGQIPTPSFSVFANTDESWGYRSVERTLLDQHNVDASTDFGVALQGRIWEKKNSDSAHIPTYVGYFISEGNNLAAKDQSSTNLAGTSPNTATLNSFKKTRATVFARFLDEKLTVGAYGDYLRTSLSPFNNENITLKGYITYKTKWFTIGAEAFRQTNTHGDVYVSNTGTTVYATTLQTGYSFYLTGSIVPQKLAYFVRYDYYNPDANYNNSYLYTKTGALTGAETGASAVATSNATIGANNFKNYLAYNVFYTQSFYSIGVDYSPSPRFHIIPNLWYNGYTTVANSGLVGTGSGKYINYTATERNSSDVVPRITFSYIFNTAKKVSANGRND